jgi:hypothetical protein
MFKQTAGGHRQIHWLGPAGLNAFARPVALYAAVSVRQVLVPRCRGLETVPVPAVNVVSG